MTNAQKGGVPEWAFHRADEELGDGVNYRNAFARYIADHEEPPVDPLTKAVDDAWVLLPPEWTRETFVASVTKTLRDRGIEIGGGA